MAIAAALLILALLIIGIRGRKRSNFRHDTAAGIAAGHRPWDGPDHWRGKAATRSPMQAARRSRRWSNR